MIRHFLLSTLAATFVLSGCASFKKQPLTPEPTQKEVVNKVKARPFEGETLYNLLVAEIAGQRKRFDIALGNYLKEAHKTQDPGVAQRATQIAQFIAADQAALDAALLWSQLEPDNIQSRQSAALQLLKAKRFDEAFAHIDELMQKQASAPFDALLLIHQQLSPEDRQKITLLLDNLLLQYPQDPRVLLTTASIQPKEQHVEALSLVNRALDKEPQYTAAILLKARLLQQQNKLELATELLKEKSEQITRAHEKKSLRKLLARILWDNKQTEKAHQVYKNLSTSYPRDGSMRLLYALTAREIGDVKTAQDELNVLIHLKQHLDTANYYLGYFAEQDKEPEAALTYYQKVKAGRDLLAAQIRITRILINQALYQQALEHIRSIETKQDTSNEQLTLLESEVLVQLGQLQQAFDLLNSAMNPESPSMNLMYARAMLAERMDNLAQMEADFKNIIAAQPDNASALNALGYTLANKTDRSEEALALITRANVLAPDDPAIIDSLGWVHYRMGNIQKSLKLLQRAYKSFPDHEVAAHLGEVLWVQGNKEQAQGIWQEGLKQNPDSEIVNEAIKRLTGKDSLIND